MIQIVYKNNALILENADKKQVSFDTTTLDVQIDGTSVAHPGEYEKSEILVEVKEYSEVLFYNFLVDGKHVLIVPKDSFELKEEILSFFGDVDILLIIGTKEAAKVFESIEAKLVVPYGEGKDIFLNTLGQHSEEVENYKVKSDLPIDTTEFVNLAQ